MKPVFLTPVVSGGFLERHLGGFAIAALLPTVAATHVAHEVAHYTAARLLGYQPTFVCLFKLPFLVEINAQDEEKIYNHPWHDLLVSGAGIAANATLAVVAGGWAAYSACHGHPISSSVKMASVAMFSLVNAVYAFLNCTPHLEEFEGSYSDGFYVTNAWRRIVSARAAKAK